MNSSFQRSAGTSPLPLQWPPGKNENGEQRRSSGGPTGVVAATGRNDFEIEDDEESLESEDSEIITTLVRSAKLDRVLMPIPREVMHKRRVRSPEYFRTQYLSNLGIWTNSQSQQHSGQQQQQLNVRVGPPLERAEVGTSGDSASEQYPPQSSTQSTVTTCPTTSNNGGSAIPLSPPIDINNATTSPHPPAESHSRSGTWHLLPPRRLSIEAQATDPLAAVDLSSPQVSPVRGIVGKGPRAGAGVRVLAVVAEAGTREVGGGDGVRESKGMEPSQGQIEDGELSVASVGSTEGYLDQLYDGLNSNDGATEGAGGGSEPGVRKATVAVAEEACKQDFESSSRTVTAATVTPPTATATAIATATTTAALLADAAVAGGGIGAGTASKSSEDEQTKKAAATLTENSDMGERDDVQEHKRQVQMDGARNTGALVVATPALSAGVTIIAVDSGRPLENTPGIPVIAAVSTADTSITVSTDGSQVCSGSSNNGKEDLNPTGGKTAAAAAAVSRAPNTTLRPPPQPAEREETGAPRQRPRAASVSSVDTASVNAAGGGTGSRFSRIDTFVMEAVNADAAAHLGAPPLPRRDIRRDYLTNLGMKRAVVAGPGGTRTTPPIVRRSSFHHDSVDHPVTEQLKDPNGRDMTFEDVMKVVGSILKGEGGKFEREPPRRKCHTCEREKSSRGSPLLGGGGLGSVVRGRGGERGEVASSMPCRHKHVDFAPLVSAVYIPIHSEYSDRVRRSYWNSAGEIREMVYRNMIEFDAEDYNWEKVAEEEDMFYCEETHEFIHPIFFESEEESAELGTEEGAAVQEDHAEYINDGRKIPVMHKR